MDNALHALLLQPFVSDVARDTAKDGKLLLTRPLVYGETAEHPET